jgi:hypothetical protein
MCTSFDSAYKSCLLMANGCSVIGSLIQIAPSSDVVFKMFHHHHIPLMPSLAHRAEVIVFHSFRFVAKSCTSCVFRPIAFASLSIVVLFKMFASHNFSGIHI